MTKFQGKGLTSPFAASSCARATHKQASIPIPSLGERERERERNKQGVNHKSPNREKTRQVEANELSEYIQQRALD